MADAVEESIKAFCNRPGMNGLTYRKIVKPGKRRGWWLILHQERPALYVAATTGLMISVMTEDRRGYIQKRDWQGS